MTFSGRDIDGIWQGRHQLAASRSISAASSFFTLPMQGNAALVTYRRRSPVEQTMPIWQVSVP
jgi:hypothetical protein